MPKITQIIPAHDSVRAFFARQDGTLFKVPVIAYGLDENGDVHPMSYDSDDGIIKPVTQAQFPSLLAVAVADQQTVAHYTQKAKEWAEARKAQAPQATEPTPTTPSA
jgi:hypothetical protein